MRTVSFKNTLVYICPKSPHLRGDLGHFKLLNKTVFEQHN